MRTKPKSGILKNPKESQKTLENYIKDHDIYIGIFGRNRENEFDSLMSFQPEPQNINDIEIFIRTLKMHIGNMEKEIKRRAN